MITLGLKQHERSHLPASSFPEWAAQYLCDNCGRDVTSGFVRLHAHAGPPIGPERFVCACGRPYLTGAIEWDHLGDRRQQSYIRDFLFLGPFFSVLASPFGVGLYFLMRFQGARQAGIVAGWTITLLPISLMLAMFVREVIPSIWRTRVRD